MRSDVDFKANAAAVHSCTALPPCSAALHALLHRCSVVLANNSLACPQSKVAARLEQLIPDLQVMGIVLPAVLGVAAAALVILPDSWEAIAHSLCTHALTVTLPAWEACSTSLAEPALKHAAALVSTVVSLWMSMLGLATAAWVQLDSAAGTSAWAATAAECLAVLVLAKLCASCVHHYRVCCYLPS